MARRAQQSWVLALVALTHSATPAGRGTSCGEGSAIPANAAARQGLRSADSTLGSALEFAPPQGSLVSMSQENEWLGQAVDWLVEHADAEAIQQRLSDLRRRREGIVQAPEEEDRVAWYLQMAHVSIHSPTSLDYYQAARVIPVLAAIGRDVPLLRTAKNIGDRVAKWLSNGERRTPDSLLFEFLVAGLYLRNGWEVEFLKEQVGKKTPEMRVRKDGKSQLVECKRLTMHSEGYRTESDQWWKMWVPFRDELLRLRVPRVFDVEFKRPMGDYGPDFLVEHVAPILRFVALDGVMLDDDSVRIRVAAADMTRIHRAHSHHEPS